MYCWMRTESIQAIGSICNNNVPVTGTTNKKVNEDMMLSIYKEVLETMRQRYPDDPHLYFQAFIKSKLKFYERYPSLAVIEILDLLYCYRMDSNDRVVLKEIYDRYEKTYFLVMSLSENDVKDITDMYLKELNRMREEAQHDI